MWLLGGKCPNTRLHIDRVRLDLTDAFRQVLSWPLLGTLQFPSGAQRFRQHARFPSTLVDGDALGSVILTAQYHRLAVYAPSWSATHVAVP